MLLHPLLWPQSWSQVIPLPVLEERLYCVTVGMAHPVLEAPPLAARRDEMEQKLQL